VDRSNLHELESVARTIWFRFGKRWPSSGGGRETRILFSAVPKSVMPAVWYLIATGSSVGVGFESLSAKDFRVR